MGLCLPGSGLEGVGGEIQVGEVRQLSSDVRMPTLIGEARPGGRLRRSVDEGGGRVGVERTKIGDDGVKTA